MTLHKNIKFITWFNFFLDFRFYAPVAILYFAEVTGSYALGMSIFSTAMLSSAVFEVPTGIFSDMIGRKKTIVIGAFATLFSVIFYAIGGVYVALFIGAIFEGFARSLYSGNNEALLHETLSEGNQQSEYSEFLGRTRSAEQVALAIASVSGAIIAYWSFSLVMWLSVIPAVLGLLVSFKIVEPKILKSKTTNIYFHLKIAIKEFRRNKKLRMLSIASILGFAQGESSFQFRSAFIVTLWPIWAIGISKTLSNIGAALSFYYSGRLIRRFGEYKMVITGRIYALITDIVAVTFPNIFSPVLLSSNSIFFGVNTVTTSTLKQREFTKEQRSTMGSLISLGRSIAFAIVAFLLGFVADVIGPAKAYLSVKILAAISLGIYWKLFRGERCLENKVT
ncbi:MAG: MFS transporter [Patescibacteria group bacterium]